MYIDNVLEIRNFLKGEYSVIEGKIFFTEPPRDTEIQPEEQHWTKWKKANLAYFTQELEREENSKIIFDIGVGGAPFREILSRFEKVIGIDFYPYKHATVISDFTRALPFKDACCDIIFMSNVLEHIPNPENLISECYRVLKSEGHIVATVPFLISIHRQPYDFHRYTHIMLERMLGEAGFMGIRIESLGSPIYLYETMQRQFFTLLPKTFLAYLWKKFAWWIFNFFKKFFSNLPASDFYVQGYGVYAKKP